MKRIAFKILVIFYIILVSFSSFSSIDDLRPCGDFYVNDFSNVIKMEDKNLIIESAKIIAENEKIQIVIVTLPSLEGKDLSLYSNELFNNWGIGNESNNYGVLVLLVTDDKKLRIEIGFGLEPYLTDAFCKDLIDSAISSYFKQNEYSEGLRFIYNELLIKIYQSGLIGNEYIDESTYERNEDGTYIKRFFTSKYVTTIKFSSDGNVIYRLRQNRTFFDFSHNNPFIYKLLIALIIIVIGATVIILSVLFIKDYKNKGKRQKRIIFFKDSNIDMDFGDSDFGFGGESGGGGFEGSW